MDKSFKTRTTVELVGEESGTVFHRTVSEELTLDMPEVAVILPAITKAVLDASVAANAAIFAKA